MAEEILVHEIIDNRGATLKHIFFDTEIAAKSYVLGFIPGARKDFMYIHRPWSVSEISKCWVEDRRHRII